jgi:hypothetical protein
MGVRWIQTDLKIKQIHWTTRSTPGTDESIDEQLVDLSESRCAFTWMFELDTLDMSPARPNYAYIDAAHPEEDDETNELGKQ